MSFTTVSRTVALNKASPCLSSNKTASAAKSRHAQQKPVGAARNVVVAASADRDLWYPGAEAPSYLDGSMGGDFGFDPLRLGANAELLPWYREAELMNGRWAMMAVPGIVMVDALGIVDKWWEAGAVDTALPRNTLIAVEVIVMAILEYKRIEGFKKTGATGFLGSYPFDPMGMASTPEAKEDKMTKEVMNGRLAMLAFLGFCSQAAVRGMGPVACLQAHLADPAHNNIFTSSVGLEATVAVVALACTPMVIHAQKVLSDKKEEFRPIPW